MPMPPATRVRWPRRTPAERRARVCLVAFLAALTLAAAACASEQPADPDAAETADTEQSGDSVEEGGADESGNGTEDDRDDAADGGDEDPDNEDSQAVEGPEAPGFTLELADGSEFVLSAEDRVTFLVFWAEW